MQISIKRTDNKFVFIKDEKILFWGTLANKRFGFIKQLYNQENKLVTEAAFKFRLPFTIIHKIRFLNTPQNDIMLRFSNIFKPKYVCEYDSDLYEIIPHKGLKTSIFKNGKQIGYYMDKQVEYIGGQTIFLLANEDINQDLIFTFILAVKCNFNNDYSTVSVDIGNFGPEVYKFDTSWKPSNIS